MRYTRLRGRDGGDLARVQVSAMTKHGVRGEYSTLFVNVSVIARAHVKMTNFLDLFAVLREVRLEISLKSRRKLSRTAHQLFRTSNGKTRAERVLEPAILGAMPFSAKALAFQERDRKDFFRLQLAVRAKVHHHFTEDRANAAVASSFESDLTTVFIDCCVSHDRGGPVADELVKKLRRFSSRFRAGEIAFYGKDVLAEPGQ